MSPFGCNSEAGEPRVAGVVDKCVRRFNILVDEALSMGLAKCMRQTYGNTQKVRQFDRRFLVLLYDPI